jgi:hypothetical protein
MNLASDLAIVWLSVALLVGAGYWRHSRRVERRRLPRARTRP